MVLGGGGQKTLELHYFLLKSKMSELDRRTFLSGFDFRVWPKRFRLFNIHLRIEMRIFLNIHTSFFFLFSDLFEVGLQTELCFWLSHIPFSLELDFRIYRRTLTRFSFRVWFRGWAQELYSVQHILEDRNEDFFINFFYVGMDELGGLALFNIHTSLFFLFSVWFRRQNFAFGYPVCSFVNS